MTKRLIAFTALMVLALIANVPTVAPAAESIQSGRVQTAQNTAVGPQNQPGTGPPTPSASVNQNQADVGRGQIPQPKGGTAIVIGVDQPDNCLRVRSGPGNSYDVIGCVNMGSQLNITGVWASNDWAQLADKGWVYGPQIQTDLRPPRTAYRQGPSYVVTEEITPDYDDWAYLPDYGYNTYWYGGIPIFFYNVGVWHRFHPWWRYHGHQAWWWQGGHHGRRAWNPKSFNTFARTGGAGAAFTNRANVSTFNRSARTRNFRTGHSNISSGNLNRLHTNTFKSGSTNAFRSRTFSNTNALRHGSVNAYHSRNFSTPHTFNSGSFARSFSTPHTFNSGSFGRGNFGGAARLGGVGGHHR